METGETPLDRFREYTGGLPFLVFICPSTLLLCPLCFDTS